MAKATSGRAFRKLALRTMAGVTRAPFPAFIEPMHPTQHARPPAGERWQFEIKLDGWRGQLHLRNGSARMFSRNGHDITEKCATIATAAAALPASAAVFDGEIVVQDSRGVPDFLALRSAMSRNQGGCSSPSTCCTSTATTSAPRRSPIAGPCWHSCSPASRAAGSS